MIKIEKEPKCFTCDNCGKPKDNYRNIHSFVVAAETFNLCTECMSVLLTKITNEFDREFPNREKTDEDIKIESILRILLNRKIFDDWNEDCEKELQSLNPDTMRPSERLLYKQIVNW